MGVTDAAVVGEEYVGAARDDVEESQQRFGIFVDAACGYGNKLDAVLGVERDGTLEAFDDAVLMVWGSVKNAIRERADSASLVGAPASS